ncbi:hypothetical protein [Microtetraspora niveoalba]|uniref:hypothetical protein n=1 Tax=Microtetraspora niveoalba TaxID=46175 RepID=UPI00082FE8A4|nr:hypothetical protein [Microtetraspora niveoalba]
MPYATTDDLADYISPAPSNAALLLTRASRLVDRALLCAVYDVDEQGQPTDPKVAKALREATCEQVAAWDEGGETGTGAADQYSNVSIGSVALGRAGGGSAGGGRSAAEDLCPQAVMILQQAGLTGHEPRTRTYC